MDLGEIAKGLASSPLPWLLALALFAIAYLYKELAQANKDRLAASEACQKEKMELFEKVIPLSIKLSDAVIALDRVSERLLRERQP